MTLAKTMPLALVLGPLIAGGLLAVLPCGPALARRVALTAATGHLLLTGFAILVFEPAPVMAGGGGLSAGDMAFSAPWLPVTGTALSLTVDGLNQYALLALAACLLLAVAVDGLFDGGVRRARLALAFCAAGALALVLCSGDLMLAAAGHGLGGLALAALLALAPGRGSALAAQRFATWAVVGAMLFAAAAALAGADRGTTVVAGLAGASPGRAAALLLLLALATQVPLVPFHHWLVPACAHGSVAGRVLVVGAWCGAGVFGLLRFGLTLFPAEAQAAAPGPAVWAGLSAAWAGVLALTQTATDLPRRVAWATLSTAGLMSAGALGLDSLPAIGATAMAAAHGLPRAALLVLAIWLTCDAGIRAGAAWLTLALVVIAAPGGSIFPGWLSLLAGTVAANPLLGWLLLAATAAAGLALLAPTVSLARRPGGAAPAPVLRRAFVLVLCAAAVTGLRPEPFLAWARPEVERLLAEVPGPDDAVDAETSDAGEDDGDGEAEGEGTDEDGEAEGEGTDEDGEAEGERTDEDGEDGG